MDKPATPGNVAASASAAPASATMLAAGSSPDSRDDDARIQRAAAQIRSLLVPGESLEALAAQRRLFALRHRRVVVAATSGRFIALTRHIFGGFDLVDVRWQDLQDVRLNMGIFGADLSISALSGPDLAIAGVTHTLEFTGLRKREAEAIYRLCQAHEQAWREKRRIRELEELRAKSGGIQLGAGGLSGAPATAADGIGGDDPVSKLERARTMRDKGLITDAEYESLKARIVSSL
jgi:putative oligomerization/nucleic acid binding protein/PH (Pleckstrin Homology) domain-containing protein